MLNRTKQLQEEGFRQIRSLPVLLPHQLWKVDIEVEEERPLRHVDETVLRLVDAGVTGREDLMELMGTEPDVAVPRALGRLLKHGALSPQDGGFRITRIGKAHLSAQKQMEPKTFKSVRVRFDPWQQEFYWEIDEERTKADGQQTLPAPKFLEGHELKLRHRELQKLMDDKGIPGMAEDKRKVKRDIVDLKPVRPDTRWREVTLEVWRRESDGEYDLRVVYRGGEPPAMTAAVRQLQLEGRVLLPLEAPPPPSSPAVRQVEEVATAVAVTGRILKTDDHRHAFKQMLEAAQREILLVSPWLTTDAVDAELLGWIENALKKKPKLMIHIGYGIGDTPTTGNTQAATRKADDQRRAIGQLEKLGQRFQRRLRLVEIGTTHQKLLVRDREDAIVTSFNWLSYRPRPDRTVRMETGTRVNDAASVAELLAELLVTLRVAM